MLNGLDSKGKNGPRPSTGCSNTGKCLGLPCAAAVFFIIFTVLYSPDSYKRSIAGLPFDALKTYTNSWTPITKDDQNLSNFENVNRQVIRAFPLQIIDWLRSCNKISPLIVLESDALQCLYNLSNQTCFKKSITSSIIYRFAFIDDGQKDPVLLLSKMITESISLGWYVKNLTSSSRSIVLKKLNILVLSSIMELRPNYWYVHGTQADDLVQESPHAFLGLNLSSFKLNIDDDNEFFTPNPLDYFIWQWPRSTFLECNRTSSEYLHKKYPDIYNTTPTIDDNYLEILTYCRDLLLKRRLTVMLAGGTGLGWYRECGIIPYTTDMDFMFLANEWNSAVERDLRFDSKLKLYWILGKPSDSLELSVMARSTKIDLFALYEEMNRSWVGGMIVPERAKLRWWYPRYDGACAADLKGHLFYVRCDIIPFLKADYGSEWYEPHHNKNFVWYKSHHNIERKGTWKLSEWSKVYRTF